jgi:hypothetical protein
VFFVIVCNLVVLNRKYLALNFCKVKLGKELAQLMNDYTGCTCWSATLFYLYFYGFNDACYISDGIDGLSCVYFVSALVNMKLNVPLFCNMLFLICTFFLNPGIKMMGENMSTMVCHTRKVLGANSL